MKRTIEINETLKRRVEIACECIQELMLEWLNDNADSDGPPDLFNDLDYSGGVHEHIDSAVPVYTGEIRDQWRIYWDELEDAYKNAGIGENPMENYGMVAIYCYIEQQVAEWYEDEKEDIYDDWRKKHPLDDEDEE